MTPAPDQRDIAIQWIERAEEIPPWLWKKCFPAPLEGFWWYATLDQCEINDQFSFSYAVLLRAGTRIGIAPTFLMDMPLDIVAPMPVSSVCNILSRVHPRFKYQRTLFVGSPCSDEGTVGLVPGESLSDVTPVLQRELDTRARRLKASMVVWKDLPAYAASEIGPLLTGCGLFSLTSYPGTRMEIRGKGFEDYLRSLGSNQRHQLKKKLRKSRVMGELEESVVQHPDDALLDEIFSLFLQTYERSKTKFERLTPAFFKRISSWPVSHFILLRDASNGNPVAFMLCFLSGKRAINKFIGIDYSYQGEWFLYFRLWEAAVK
ncbi:MAG TPA: GNAT family N-acetyltransferase, partial [Dissulfurispiraceae bacterium]